MECCYGVNIWWIGGSAPLHMASDFLINQISIGLKWSIWQKNMVIRLQMEKYHACMQSWLQLVTGTFHKLRMLGLPEDLLDIKMSYNDSYDMERS